MGGGGGGDYRDQVNLERLRERVREQLKQGQGRRHVFLSFAAEDLATVNALRAQAANSEADLDFDDWSVRVPFDSENADYMRGKIRERIQRSSAVLVLVTPDSSTSKWVDWEINEGLRQGKQVFAVYSGDTAPSVLPKAVRENRLPVVRWTHDGIMAELEKDE